MCSIIQMTIYTADSLFLSLCIKSLDRDSLNILSIVTLLYQTYIDYEIINLAYNTSKNILYNRQFVNRKMGKWDGKFSLLEILRSLGH